MKLVPERRYESIEDDLRRYIEVLQRQLLTSGAESVFDHEQFLSWTAKNRERLQEAGRWSLTPSKVVEEFEEALYGYKPRFSLDSFHAQGVFEPILETVLRAANASNLAPRQRIILANSPDLCLSAISRPSTGEHLIFAGIGTYAFCNYWAKLVAQLVSAFRVLFPGKRINGSRLRETLRQNPSVAIQTVRLVAYSRIVGTVVGFGVMPGDSSTAAFRLELLNAMETFVIGHEVGHCYFAERGEPSSAVTQAEEFACDLYSLVICRAAGNERSSWSHFSGSGAYVLLRLATICAPGKEDQHASSSHPPTTERAQAVLEKSIEAIVDDQRDAVFAYLHEMKAICDEIGSLVAEVLSNASRPISLTVP